MASLPFWLRNCVNGRNNLCCSMLEENKLAQEQRRPQVWVSRQGLLWKARRGQLHNSGAATREGAALRDLASSGGTGTRSSVACISAQQCGSWICA